MKFQMRIPKLILFTSIGAVAGIIVLTIALMANEAVFSNEILERVELPIREKGLHRPQNELLLQKTVALREKGCHLIYLSGFLDKGASFIIAGILLSFSSVYMFDIWKTATKPIK
jgi:hypothetical protein